MIPSQQDVVKIQMAVVRAVGGVNVLESKRSCNLKM